MYFIEIGKTNKCLYKCGTNSVTVIDFYDKTNLTFIYKVYIYCSK